MEDKSKSGKRLVVIGGGAAGFFCAVNAARMNRHLEVILLEKTGKLLSKVRVSGGGRCNVTHASFDIAVMSRQYPRGENFVKKIFHRFFTADTIRWFESRGVKLKTEKDGRVFPVSDSSQTIIECLLREAGKYDVEIMMNAGVTRISITPNKFTVHLTGSRSLSADYICIACGGFPGSGAYDWITAMGHTIEEPVPSLFTFNLPHHPITKLMGITVENAGVKIAGTKLKEQGPLLITHWGLSGPVVLRLSAWGARELKKMNYEFTIHVNWLPGFNEQSVKEKMQQLRTELAPQKLRNKSPFGLPGRLWEFLTGESSIKNETRWADLTAREQQRLIRNLCAYECEVKGRTTFKEEFVTAGGIMLNEVDPHTMMSKKVPGLFFAGEILNVDGITGGFNFQHAWTTGYIASASMAESG